MLLRKIILLTTVSAISFAWPLQAQQFKVLLFTKTAGWHHESINEGVDAIRTLGQEHFFEVVWSEDASRWMNDEMLARFDAIIFLNTTGDILTGAQQAAMERFIRSGKGFVGIHSASDTEYDWPWYRRMVGRMFRIHPTIQTARLLVLDRSFPGLEFFPDSSLWTDEWYEFGPEETTGLTYILAVDEKSYAPEANWGSVSGQGMGEFHPIAWYHHYDGGRAFYTALGHLPSKFSDHAFLQHLFGGIYWAATGKGLN